MNDSPIKPIRPVGRVQSVREIGLRRRPSLFQLRQWLNFVKRKNHGKRKALPGSDEPTT